MEPKYLRLRRGPHATLPVLNKGEIALILDREKLAYSPDGTTTKVLGDVKSYSAGILYTAGTLLYRDHVLYQVDVEFTATDWATDGPSCSAAFPLKADLVDGRIPSGQLPSYVDDVLEYANLAALPEEGEGNKIYVTLDTNLTYRWSGTQYVEISKSLALGTTETTAHRGDHGDTAYQHSQATGNPHGTDATDVGLGNVTNNAQLTREAADWAAFTEKTVLADDDYIILEDSEDVEPGKKKKVKVGTVREIAKMQAIIYG